MSVSTNLNLPYLAAGQAQKHVTVNESLLRLDALVQGNVVSRTVSAEPGSPSDGQVYILPSGKTGASWGAMTNGALAYFRDGVWEEIVPREGWTVFVRDEDQHVVWSGAAWAPMLASNQTAGFRNRLLNASFMINQRAAASNADDTYCFDRWYVLTQSGAVACSALTDPEAGRPTGLRITQSQAGAQRIGVAQIVESANIRDLRSQAVAMAARIRCSSSQPIRMAILEWAGAADAVTSDVVNTWTSTTYTAGNFFIAGVNVIAVGASTPAANTWADMTQITGQFGAALNNAIVFVWSEGALVQNATLDLDQAQLEAGAACGAFARRTRAEELANCMRYYEIIGGLTGGIYTSTRMDTVLRFAVEKHKAPALSILNATGGFYQVGGGNNTVTSLTIWAAATVRGVGLGVNASGASFTAGAHGLLLDGVVGADAEL